jgi:hypothetical protein
VLVRTNEKYMILACSKLCMHFEKIILAYSCRFIIEAFFKIEKEDYAGN